MATSGALIQRIGIFQIQNISIDGAFLENFQFSKHIPEPSALVRVGLGFMGFVRLRRTVTA
ncbi:PEP-CTERM sorting domain-containing protein [Methylovulum miyakonense]|uniref:PEP-CTERM sorting domain-containing protein n=1 Tax=Methylovulum miyakonense TaxID=645578 RepID=UPI003BB529FC